MFIILFAIELIYFKLANRYNIIDHPNHRSSHTKVTIRGGGIIFSMALLLSPVYLGWHYGYFLIGLFLVSAISFIDDIKTIGNGIRISVHLIAVILLFYQLNMYSLPLYWVVIGFVVVIGTINAINFMDGINGITGAYGLITLGMLYYINASVINFTSSDFLLLAILAVLVFIFFNFRTKAKCFAGDVGSVSLAFIILFFLLQLILKTNNLNYILLLLVYGLDTATTIFFRIIRKEKISEAHRSHFYQFLVNEKKLPHLLVAVIYAVSQGLINIILIVFLSQTIYTLLVLIFISIVLFICIRIITEGPARLFKANPVQF
ncbi:UDP-GlcNAc--UDP-phosphate GlcNAc-1-phosphate transferase [Mucilaginibacter sp.]|jgi:UDP-N-acetylmuramyl pentapeptide phosphotransferase/UDP-N-acetylglucosamine-1-phosphate transferase|uniref:UDP-GlcNAc--UDP-phosphate GlcNAc-1-phosphate transferase n=1 Tax=Mucilaginibacter sp. TaxID=1882438 RepID=UPI0035628661